MADKVLIYNPNTPGHPAEILAANFHPERHVRWEYRPTVSPVRFDEAVSETHGEETVFPVSKDQADALEAAGVSSLLDVLAVGDAGLRGVPGVGRATARSILAWANAHPLVDVARAEMAVKIAAEEKAVRAAEAMDEGALAEPSATTPADDLSLETPGEADAAEGAA